MRASTPEGYARDAGDLSSVGRDEGPGIDDVRDVSRLAMSQRNPPAPRRGLGARRVDAGDPVPRRDAEGHAANQAGRSPRPWGDRRVLRSDPRGARDTLAAVVRTTGATEIHPYDHPDVTAGQ